MLVELLYVFNEIIKSGFHAKQLSLEHNIENTSFICTFIYSKVLRMSD